MCAYQRRDEVWAIRTSTGELQSQENEIHENKNDEATVGFPDGRSLWVMVQRATVLMVVIVGFRPAQKR